MNKLHSDKNPYEILGISAADAADSDKLKKRYRLSALEHHPDRNRDNPIEATEKFQNIQWAYAILSTPNLKADYDSRSNRKSAQGSSYPSASGVYGNPWKDVASKHQKPPSHPKAKQYGQQQRHPPPATPRQKPGGDKWTEFGRAPTSKPQPPDQEDLRSAWQGFMYMRRKNATDMPEEGATARPPPVPPRRQTDNARTQAARQRPEGAFSNRRSGYSPRSPMPEDEPQASPKNYETTRHTDNGFADAARRERMGTFASAAAAAATATTAATAAAASAGENTNSATDDSSDDRRENIYGGRRSSEHRTRAGERSGHFDGSRPARSARERRRRTEDPSESPDSRSAASGHHRRSGFRSAEPAGREPSESSAEEPPRPPGRVGSNYSMNSNTSRASAKYVPRTASFDSLDEVSPGSTPQQEAPGDEGMKHKSGNPRLPADAAAVSAAAAADKLRKDSGLQKDTPMYDIQPSTTSSAAGRLPKVHIQHSGDDPVNFGRFFPGFSSSESPSSGGKASVDSLTSFERWQQSLLNNLIKVSPVTPRGTGQSKSTSVDVDSLHNVTAIADKLPYSFNRPAHDVQNSATTEDGAAPDQDNPDNFGFSPLLGPTGVYRFHAGGSSKPPPERRRTRVASRRTPMHTPSTLSDEDLPGLNLDTENGDRGFDPEEWSQKFSPQTFAPRPTSGPSTSPAKAKLRKARSVKMSMGNGNGTGSSSEDASSDDEAEDTVRQAADVRFASADAESPSAMDLDPEPPSASIPTAAPPTNGARSIAMEPSRRDWRAGDTSSIRTDAAGVSSAMPAFNPNNAGSEDIEEFRTNLADLRNVAPFAAERSGLESFGDLQSNLPFDSQPSARLHLPRDYMELEFPPVPVAPFIPSALVDGTGQPSIGAWEMYEKQVIQYIKKWDEFNSLILSHFNERDKSRKLEGYISLTDQDDEMLKRYRNEVLQDNSVRRKWIKACAEHEQRLEEFMTLRLRMK